MNRVQTSVVAFDVVVVLLCLAMIPHHLYLVGEIGIVGGDGPGFAAGAQIFPRVKTERGCASHGARLHPAIVFAGKIFGAVCLASVFNHGRDHSFSASLRMASMSAICP